MALAVCVFRRTSALNTDPWRLTIPVSFDVQLLIGAFHLCRALVAHTVLYAALFCVWLCRYHSMGLFLQKTNIIRDYLEDYVDGRAFWPQDVWKKHSKTGQLGEFALPQAR